MALPHNIDNDTVVVKEHIVENFEYLEDNKAAKTFDLPGATTPRTLRSTTDAPTPADQGAHDSDGQDGILEYLANNLEGRGGASADFYVLEKLNDGTGSDGGIALRFVDSTGAINGIYFLFDRTEIRKPLVLHENAALPTPGADTVTLGIKSDGRLYTKDENGVEREIGGDTPYELTDGATIAIDWNNGRKQYVTIADDRTLTFANPRVGDAYTLKIKQDGTGGRELTWPAGVVWLHPSGAAPDLSGAAANSHIIVTLLYMDGEYSGNYSGI